MSRLSVADFLIGCVEWFLCNHVRFIQVSGVGISRETYDTVEVQDCHSQLRTCMQRISDVEAINVDLEARLESQAREYIELESDAAESLACWKNQYEALVKEASSWKHMHAQQVLKNQKVREQLLRTERELHGILQKKYDIMEFARREERDRIRAERNTGLIEGAQPLRGSDVELARVSSTDCVAPKRDRVKDIQFHHNPIGAPPQDVRRGRAVLALADFFRFDLHKDERNQNRPSAPKSDLSLDLR
mmetsp:Transcript_541/g.1846  ORF Transcript_541/g.1846 Transcript_541/m.1846 type:complete len:247 (-) Transcript_541:181-921(-)